MPVEYRGFEGVTKFFYLACTKIQGVQVSTTEASHLNRIVPEDQCIRALANDLYH